MPHNIQVVHPEPQKIFEQADQSAVARSRFQPSWVEGEPQPFYDLSKRVRFNLNER